MRYEICLIEGMALSTTKRTQLTSLMSCLTLVAVFSAPSYLAADSRRFQVTDLGSNAPSELNERGQVAINQNAGRAIAGLWDRGSVRVLDEPNPSYYSGALGINNQGQVVGYGPATSCFACPLSTHAMIWQPDGTRTMLPHLAPSSSRAEANGSEAQAINNRGDIVGWSFRGVAGRGGWQQAVLWRNGQATELAPADTASSAAYGINDNGDVVGWVSVATPEGFRNRPFLWSGSMTNLAPLAAGNGSAIAYAINSTRQVVGTADIADGGKRAVRWENGSVADLGTLNGDTDSEAFAINTRGDVGGKSYNRGCPTCAPRAVIWTNGQIRDLNQLIAADSGWQLQEVIDIDDEGRVAGRGLLNGEPRYFLLEN